MNTNTDITKQLKSYIDITDDLTAKNILEMLEVKETSLWFRDENTTEISEDFDVLTIEEKELSYEQIKEMYPAWFNQ